MGVCGRFLGFTAVLLGGCGFFEPIHAPLGFVEPAGHGPDVAPPRLAATIGGMLAPHSPTCTLFPPDTTGGQLAQHRQIVITNTGAKVGAVTDKLCLKWSATKTNSQFKLSVVSGATKDDAFCGDVHKGLPGAMAAVEVNKGKLVLDVEYKANQSGDTDPFVVTLESNSGNIKGQSETAPADVKKQQHCFNVAKIGVCANLAPNEYIFTNAAAGFPPAACFNLENCSSTHALTFLGAEFGTNNSQYEIIEQPNANDVIAPKGDPQNPDGQTALKICVQYAPDNTNGNEDVMLRIDTNDPAGATFALISAESVFGARWHVNCADSSGKLGFLFADVTKNGTSKCTICNEGPPALKVQDVKVEAANAEDDTVVAAALKCRVVDSKGAEQNPYAVNSNKCVDILCDYKPQSTGKPPPAMCHIRHASAMLEGSVYLPITVGGCDTPNLQFGPRPELALQAKSGSTATGTAVIANQSCASLHIASACIAKASYKGDAPCDNPSPYHALAQDVSDVTIDSFGLLNLPITFTPGPAPLFTNVNDLLHVAYCAGVWSGGACSGQTVTRKLDLWGKVQQPTDPAAPIGACALLDPKQPVVAGQAVPIVMTILNPGGFANQTFFYRWVVAKRPVGATTWLPQGQQSTDQIDTVTVLPDAPGQYTVLCQVQGIDNEDANKNAWSPQTAVTFQVAPK